MSTPEKILTAKETQEEKERGEEAVLENTLNKINGIK